ncbi:nuclear transport factor 2 family protein [Sphingobium sp.]|uniref:nuclear transport factor 2 family protein n=1 Tax=Sphingobium sp. TaxID=1912891 RepID=UPI002BDDB9F8|nr:nuclear transport factor 2 family protein [Sphingobium sp.]HUD93570.1 nuclear transport factor 2 family protein [Sphingobium sp.]
MSHILSSMLDRDLLLQTAELYACGADRRDKALWRTVLAEDCVIEGPGFASRGLDNCLSAIDTLTQMFRATQHRVHQQVAVIDGDRATGETYCIAEHLLHDQDSVLVWTIRYQDEWRREATGWCFTRRQLILDWTETRAVEVPK